MKKIADAVVVAMMLVASVPGLAEDVMNALPTTSAVQEQMQLPSAEDEQ